MEMRDFFSDIFDYHNHFNQKLIGQLIDNERVLPAGTIPLFCHIINAHQIWNSRITNREKFGVHQLHSLSICSQIDNDNFKETQNILKRFSLDKDRKSTRLNSSHVKISYAVFCLKK